MSNNINTLNGSLAELGESMASNLVAMGVSDADASDGLTTLANRILDIPVTPIAQTLTLTSNKSELSYLDSDTATLTATLTGRTVSGQTIEFFNGNTSMGTAQTDSNGVATKTYSSSGVGDVIFSATKGSLTSQAITVTDYIKYDDGSVDKSSSWYIYNPNSLVYSITNSNNEYTINKNGKSDTYIYFEFASIDDSVNVEYEFDFNATSKSPSSGGWNMGMHLLETVSSGEATNGISFGSWSSSKYMRYAENNAYLKNSTSSGVLSTNVWYHFKCIINENYVFAQISQNGSNVINYENSNANPQLSTMSFAMYLVSGSSCVSKIKNIKVKVL